VYIPQPIVVLLSGGVPQLQFHGSSVDHDVGNGRFEHGRQIQFGKLVATENVQKTRLAASAVSHNDYVHTTLNVCKQIILIRIRGPAFLLPHPEVQFKLPVVHGSFG